MSPRLLLLLAISFAIAERAAAADDPTRRRFDPDPPRLALSLDGNFTTETAAAADRGNWRFASVFDLAGGLLVLQQGSQRQDLMTSRGLLHLLGGWSLGRLELAAELPIALWQNSDFSLLTSQGVTGPLVAPVSSTTMGDLRLGVKVPILDGTRAPVGLSALVDLRLPTGSAQAVMSDGAAVVPSVGAASPRRPNPSSAPSRTATATASPTTRTSAPTSPDCPSTTAARTTTATGSRTTRTSARTSPDPPSTTGARCWMAIR